MNAYCVPAVRFGGELNENVMNPPEALDVPGIVALASRPPAVITGTPPLVVRTSPIRLGSVPEQVAQKMTTSRRVSCPVTLGVKVWPGKLVVVKPTPLVLASSTFRSIAGAFTKVTLPGLVVKSQLVGTPSW